MAKWEDLNMHERHAFIRTAVKNGIKDIGSIRDKYNEYANGGEIIEEIPSGKADKRSLALTRANYVASNYSQAKDFHMNPVVYQAKKWAKDNFGIGGLSNCTLTATQWIDPNNPYMAAKNIFNNPSSGYTEITADEAIPGDLLIAKNPEHGTYHTMLIENFDKQGKPLLTYSRGGHDDQKNLVKGIPLDIYHKTDASQGGNHTEDHYFRYNYSDEHWLPEVVVTAPRLKANGGGLDFLSKPFSYKPVPKVRY